MHVSDGKKQRNVGACVVCENMDADRDADLIMTTAPLPSSNSAGSILDLIPASSHPGSSGDQHGEAMELSHGECR